jgi:hypothetical protein
LRQAVHIHRRPLARVVIRQRFQQIDRTLEVLADGGLGGRVIQPLDLVDRVHVA